MKLENKHTMNGKLIGMRKPKKYGMDAAGEGNCRRAIKRLEAVTFIPITTQVKLCYVSIL